MTPPGDPMWRHARGLCHRRSGLGWVVLTADGGQPLMLEDGAAAVFEMLDQPMTADDLLAGVCEGSGLDPTVIRTHLESALALLADAGVITNT